MGTAPLPWAAVPGWAALLVEKFSRCSASGPLAQAGFVSPRSEGAEAEPTHRLLPGNCAERGSSFLRSPSGTSRPSRGAQSCPRQPCVPYLPQTRLIILISPSAAFPGLFSEERQTAAAEAAAGGGSAAPAVLSPPRAARGHEPLRAPEQLLWGPGPWDPRGCCRAAHQKPALRKGKREYGVVKGIL